MAAYDPQGLSFRREAIASDAVGREVCELVAGRAIQRLQPQVVDAIFIHGIDDCLSIRSEFRMIRNPWISVQEASHRAHAVFVEVYQCNQLLVRV